MSDSIRSVSNSIDEPVLLVHAYLDGELDPVNSIAVERQIAADRALGAEVEAVAALRRVVRERLPKDPLPTAFEAKIEAAIGRTRNEANVSWRALAASVALAAVLSSGTTWMALRPIPSETVANSILDNHLRSLAAPQAADVASSERHTVKPWFNGRIPHSPQVADLTKDGFPLIGGRVDVVNTQPVATLVYGRRKHQISLSAVPTSDASERSPTPKSIRGFNIVQWNDDGVAYWAASDLNAAELQNFAQLFRAAVAQR